MTKFVLFFLCVTAHALPEILVFSGGGSPAGNHFSQYLQTKTLTEGLRSNINAPISVQFAAGNNTNSLTLADVHKSILREDAPERSEMLYGVIEGNESASKQNLISYFSKHTTSASDPFFLFVSDHGMPNKPKTKSTDPTFENNCIDSWTYNATELHIGEWQERCLSKDELGALLRERVQRPKKIFVMSQCFSGGFHQMSVTETAGYPSADTSICGFTATTEDTTASGCTPNVDGPNYKGYERFFTQELTGVDVVSGKILHPFRKGIKNAHYAAATQDTTKDIPLRTSDYYLLQWADKIRQSDFIPRSGVLNPQKIKKTYASLTAPDASSIDLLLQSKNSKISVAEKLLYLKSSLALMADEDPSIAMLVARKSSEELEQQVDEWNQQIKKLQKTAEKAEVTRSRLYYTGVTTGWREAVATGEAGVSDSEITDFENPFLTKENDFEGKPYAEMQLDRYFIFALADLTTTQPSRAKEASTYIANRPIRINHWVREKAPEIVKTAYREWFKLSKKVAQTSDRISRLELSRDHLRRILFIRKTIATTILLEQMEDKKALEELNGLLECENTQLD